MGGTAASRLCVQGLRPRAPWPSCDTREKRRIALTRSVRGATVARTNPSRSALEVCGVKCSRCEQENPAQAKFCLECGARLERRCAKCGGVLPSVAKFCPECGERVLPGDAAAATPESYTPRHLAEKIVSSKIAMEGERKQVTVLFADLKGSMELLAGRDPEEARRILDPVLERMIDAVHRYEGMVNQVMGDGIMALFGAPLAHEDHAVRACYAALTMQDTIRRYAVETQSDDVLRIRVGLNSGEVVVRAIGSDLHMDYTAVGQTTHLAARMEQLARPGTILLTAATAALTEGYVEVRSLGTLEVKGLAEPVAAWELAGATAARSRLQARAAQGLTKFVGRAAELTQLTGALERARRGRGEIVAIVGEPGVGKSRLFRELVVSGAVRDWLVLESVVASYGKPAAWLPVIELLKAYFQIEARDGDGKIRDKVTGKLYSLDASLEPLLPPLFWLLDVRDDDATWARLDPLQRRHLTLDAVKKLLLRESRVQPVALVFEDLQWIDSETQAFLDSLVDNLPAARILLLVNYRPEYRHAWVGKTYYGQLRIDPLSAPNAEELLTTLVGDAPELASLRRHLIEWTEGNPFFLEESVRTLVETKALTGGRGAYRLAQPLETIQVPPSVRSLLSARIDRLSPDDKQLLQAAAVIGHDVPFTLLAAIADVPEDALRSSLARLQAAEFLYEARLFPELEHTFTHALTHEVAYQGQLHERRRGLHARIVAAIETLFAGRLDEQADRLAHHATEAQAWDKAARYCRRAGERAAGRSAHREAVAHFERAVAAFRQLPDDRDRLPQTIDVLLQLRTALMPLGESHRIAACLHDAEALTIELGDERRLGRLRAYMTNYFYMAGDQSRALELGGETLAIAERLDDVSLRVEINYRLGQIHYTLGDYTRAVEVLERSVASLAGDAIQERFGLPALPAVIARAWLIQSLAERGDFADAARRADQAMRIAGAADHPYSLAFAYWSAGGLSLSRGDMTKAIEILERGLTLCTTWSIAVWQPRFGSSLGLAYARAGRHAEGVTLLEHAFEHATSAGVSVDRALFAVALCEGHVRARRFDEALRVGTMAVELTTQSGQRGREAWARFLLGEVAARADAPDLTSASAAYRSALAAAEQLGMRPLLAHCHRALGLALERAGDITGARLHVEAAEAIAAAIGLRWW
jgi:class 3 adenylate cyclase/tetratricopeptide (TPR) repeat protein